MFSNQAGAVDGHRVLVDVLPPFVDMKAGGQGAANEDLGGSAAAIEASVMNSLLFMALFSGCVC